LHQPPHAGCPESYQHDIEDQVEHEHPYCKQKERDFEILRKCGKDKIVGNGINKSKSDP
jgi:hypothetical protein